MRAKAEEDNMNSSFQCRLIFQSVLPIALILLSTLLLGSIESAYGTECKTSRSWWTRSDICPRRKDRDGHRVGQAFEVKRVSDNATVFQGELAPATGCGYR